MVIVVAIVLVSTSVVVLTNHLHVGTFSDKEISSNAGQTLVENKGNNTAVYSGFLPAERLAVRYFNESNGSGLVLVVSVEFSNLSQSKSLYVYTMNEWLNLNYKISSRWNNGSYNGFIFNSVFYEYGNLYAMVASGYSGSFAFYIYDSGVKLSDVTTLIHDEIQAMTS
ncbi:MAG: hypothetical protein M1556_03375 [Candidatus Thermoplasmatota archaeon]|jgi:hypothetical protein|nr:hypothetical protein [Candidatus Thermoplasmatota archaeon]